MKDKLLTRNYILIIGANFLQFFGFWLLMPVLPFYLQEVFGADKASIGMLLSCYTVAALCVRPFSGYLLDTFARKPLYLLAYFVLACMFGGYLLAGTLTFFLILRIIHGFAFGMVTVGGNTIVIDVMPSSRRGEGLGYFGLSNNVAMSIGPMTGLFMHEAGIPYSLIFSCSLGACLLGLLCVLLLDTPVKAPVKRVPISLVRFLLIKGIPAGLSLLLLSIPYGMTTNYVAMYAKQIGIVSSSGFFFTLMAIGMAVSRLFSGKLVDKGMVTQVIKAGMTLVVCCFFALSACEWMASWHAGFATIFFLLIALLLGIGFGTMFPAYNTLFVNLAPNTQRGTATSTYLTSWDIGIGIGMLLGGYISEIFGFSTAYLLGAILTVVSFFYFRLKVTGHFSRHRLR